MRSGHIRQDRDRSGRTDCGGERLSASRNLPRFSRKHPEIKIVSNQAADWDASKARAITETTLQQNKDLCGIIGFWDGMDVGTGAAVKQAGRDKDVFIVTSGGGGKAGCDNLKDGVFDLDISYDVPARPAIWQMASRRFSSPSPSPVKTTIRSTLSCRC